MRKGAGWLINIFQITQGSRMKKISLIAFTVGYVLSSCGNLTPEEAVVASISKVQYEKLRQDNQKFLGELSAGIVQAMLMADTANITDTFLLETDHLGFSPVVGTHTNDGEVNKEFNAIWVGSYAHGLPLAEGMTEDYFRSECYLNLQKVNGGKTAEEYGLGDNDERAWPTSYAFVEAMKQLRYVVVIHPKSFTAGALYLSSQTFEAASLDGVMMIYDLKENRICGAKEIHTTGPESISYSFDAPSSNNGYKDKADDAAVYEFEKENREGLFRNTLLELGSLANAAEFSN